MIFSAKVVSAVDYIRDQFPLSLDCGLILGSGLGGLADVIENSVTISYSDVPYFPRSTVSGHAGRLVFGQLEGKNVCAMQGRFHYYEGYALKEVTFPVFVMHKLGIDNLIVTNAAGGVNPSFAAGQLMIISDHINLLGNSPLIGLGDLGYGERFTNMVDAYSPQLRQIAREVASDLDVNMVEGVYAALSGPSYETPAEIRFLQTIGVDAVGMSTVPEVIIARYCKMNVLGISCITNLAAGLQRELNHSEVKETAGAVAPNFARLVRGIVERVM